ncbi:ABC transporter permease [Oerskovia sp. NPDC057915]|uniref:ABC transporter permease n=1 Tax=Oerskovia sp. NPDC057915 TaxID=3346280 RepID=UPI0036DA2508
MLKVALRGVRAHLVRFLLSALAVMLGVAFVVGTFTFRAMLSSTFDEIIATTLVADVYVRGAEEIDDSTTAGSTFGTPHSPVPVSLADTVAGVDGVARAVPDASGPIVLVAADGTAVTTSGPPSIGIAVGPDEPTVTLASGAWPVGPAEIALEESAASAADLTTGDTTTVVLAGAPQPVTVTGIFAIQAAAAGTILVGLDPATALATYAPDGTVPTISVYAAGDVSEQVLADRVAKVVPAGTESLTGEAVREEARQQVEQILGFIETFLLVFAAIALFVGTFIIANTFAMSVRERQREFALLRALGASPAQVFASILAQAVAVGLLGAATGVVLGRVLVSGLRAVFGSTGMELSGRVPLSATSVVVAISLGVLVSVVAAAVPGRRAALTPPVQAMHDDVAPDRGTGTRAVVGLVLTVLGAGLLVLASRLGSSASADPTGWALVDDLNPRVLLAVGASAALVGVLVLSPAIAGAVITVLAVPAVAAIRPLGRLARGNVTRSPRRTSNTAGALLIGMALVSATGVIAASTQASVRSIVDEQMRADYVVQGAAATGALPPGVTDAVTGLPAVGQALPLRLGTLDVDGKPSVATVVPPGFFTEGLDAPVVEGDPDRALVDGEAVVRRTAARDEGWEVGDSLTLTSDDGTRTQDVTVGAIIDTQVISSDVVLSDATYADVGSAEIPTYAVYVTAAPGTSATELRAALTDAVKPFLVVSVLDREELANAAAAQVDQVLVILYALLGLSIVIALLGIVNTLALSIIERTREIGLLRAVGLGRLQLAGIITIESVLTAVYGTVLGVLTGIAIAAALPGVLAEQGLTSLAIPWGQVLAVLGLAVVIGLVASVWPGIRASRLPVLEAVTVD